MVPSFRAMAPRLVVSGLLPVIGYALLRPHVGSDAVALVAIMVFPLADIVVERSRHRGNDPIGLIALVGMALGLIGAVLLHGDATLLKIRESMLTGVFGLVCLASLTMKRPVMWYLGRAFATGGEPDKVAEFNTIWDLPGAAQRFRFITAVWGLGLVGECAFRVALALSVSTERFLAISPIAGWVTIGGLLAYTARFSRRGEADVTAGLDQPTTV